MKRFTLSLVIAFWAIVIGVSAILSSVQHASSPDAVGYEREFFTQLLFFAIRDLPFLLVAALICTFVAWRITSKDRERRLGTGARPPS